MDTSEQIVVKRVRRRQRHPIEEKLKIVEKTLEPGASVAEVARTHGLNANQVFTWRRKYRLGQLVKAGPNLLPVQVVRTVGSKEAHSHDQCLGQIQIELPKANLLISGSADVAALRVVLEKLLG